MPNSDKQKITDEDIQAYLLGDGNAAVYAKIKKIDDSAASSLSSQNQKIKNTLETFRKVDQLFNEAIDESIGIPPHISEQIDQALNGSQASAKKNIFERLTKLVQDQFNFGSVFAGGVVGAFATVALLNSAPLFTLGLEPDDFHLSEMITRGVQEEEKLMEMDMHQMSNSNQHWATQSWQITQDIAYKFVIFDAENSQRSDTNVTLGETFDLAIIPLKTGPISIKYLSSSGEESLLVNDERLLAGKEFWLSVDKFNGKRPKFAEPIGTDSLLIISRNKIVETIKIHVN